MNWKYEAVEKLKQYEAKKQALQSIPLEISRLEIVMTSIRSATAGGAPVQGGGAGREDMMLSNIVHREELKKALEQARLWVEIVEKGLQTLSDNQRLILERLYIHPERGGVDQLCEELFVEKSSVYRRRDAALCQFTKALYGYVES